MHLVPANRLSYQLLLAWKYLPWFECNYCKKRCGKFFEYFIILLGSSLVTTIVTAWCKSLQRKTLKKSEKKTKKIFKK